MRIHAILSRSLLAGLCLLLPATAAFADHRLSERALVGGAVGGALGGYLGAELGGREGAILGGMLGAGSGVAVATPRYHTVRHRHYHAPPRHRHHYYRAPPPRRTVIHHHYHPSKRYAPPHAYRYSRKSYRSPARYYHPAPRRVYRY